MLTDIFETIIMGKIKISQYFEWKIILSFCYIEIIRIKLFFLIMHSYRIIARICFEKIF